MKNEFTKRVLSSVILLPTVLFFIIKGNFFFDIFLIVCFFIALYEWFNMSKKKKYFIFGLLFLLISFYSLYEIRKFDEGIPIYLLFVLSTCILTDLGGYFFGKVFKGPKLTKLSPNKTFSGMLGGYIFSIFFLVLINNFNILVVSNSMLFNIIFIFIISSISQIGDILISFFKRLSKIKDTGNIIPGHGGILDRIDGMIFAFPSSYIIYLFLLK